MSFMFVIYAQNEIAGENASISKYSGLSASYTVHGTAGNLNLAKLTFCGIIWEREVFDMFASQRHNQIQNLLQENGAVTIAGLVETFVISMETARRDLAAMKKAGLLNRVHGGALPLETVQFYRPLKDRKDQQHAQKLTIAKAAASITAQNGYSKARLRQPFCPVYMCKKPLLSLLCCPWSTASLATPQNWFKC